MDIYSNDTPEKMAFELGFDIYRYNAQFIINNSNNDDIVHGYNAAQVQDANQVESTIYDRKWLSIRARCLIKQREVSITPDDLKAALDASDGYCPITGDDFTFATGALTDWSVDRVDNEKPYTPENIIIISSRANQAKGDLNLSQMLLSMKTFHHDNDPHKDNHSLLSLMQWYHMISVFYNKLPLDANINFSNELSQGSTDMLTVLVSNPLFNCSGNNSFVNELFSQHLLERETLVKARKVFRKRYIKMYVQGSSQENPEDPQVIIKSSPKLQCFVGHIMTKVRENKLLDKALFDDVMSHMVNAKEAKQLQASTYHKM